MFRALSSLFAYFLSFSLLSFSRFFSRFLSSYLFSNPFSSSSVLLFSSFFLSFSVLLYSLFSTPPPLCFCHLISFVLSVICVSSLSLLFSVLLSPFVFHFRSVSLLFARFRYSPPSSFYTIFSFLSFPVLLFIFFQPPLFIFCSLGSFLSPWFFSFLSFNLCFSFLSSFCPIPLLFLYPALSQTQHPPPTPPPE